MLTGSAFLRAALPVGFFDALVGLELDVRARRLFIVPIAVASVAENETSGKEPKRDARG
jgi:hypothetical protein